MLNGSLQGHGTTAPARGYASDSGPVTDRVLLLDEATSNIHQHIERVRECVVFVRNLADGIFGPNPTDGSGKLANGTTAFRADGLRAANSGLYCAISDLSSELDRLKAL